ncbi:CTP synthetase [Octadecabacter sp. 1_MG-2023]|uniref:CTP synthetase n=1 Tax=unclassified Octadecabacter TaxID=196158 RepID=UPI001C0A5201|nr:CTP synthetase [Octadecabacter sp. 1_MG-2023]MBU2994709.1 CTP synthetase [Octadecabacter sp. B2R22]MDO6733997.1 CTP synthetase [Octadecabacter sp. 1_MG-2023]
MNPVALALFGVIASTLAGTFVVVALVSGVSGLWPLLGVAALGAVLALPAVWFISRAMGR